MEIDKIVLFLFYVFDLGYMSMFFVFLVGGEFYIVLKEIYMVLDEMGFYIKEYGIIYIKLILFLFYMMVNIFRFIKELNFEFLCLIVLGGEKIILVDVFIFCKVYGYIEFINYYGLIEVIIGVIVGWVNLFELDVFVKCLIIGQLIVNVGVFVLNELLKFVFLGVSGQFYIKGQGFVRGYFNRFQLIVERFVQNLYLLGSFMYKIGDVVWRFFDGMFEFIGWVDDQVKICGYCIELKEIEMVMFSFSGI